MANYSFLGNVEKYETRTSGISLFCESRCELRIDFLKSNLFRVTLIRPDYSEALLDYPLAKTEWEAVPIDFEETEPQLLLKSDEIDLVIQKSPCRLTVKDKQGTIINQDDPGMGIGWDADEVRCWKTITADEKFFGLGEKTGNLNKRGSEWVMWNTDNPHHDNNSDPIYQSIPFFIGMRDYQAYGIYFNNSYRSKFNFGAGNQRYYSFCADAGNLDYFFIHGPQVSQVVETFTELTGRTPMPPKWALGYQQCRWSYYPAKEVLRIAQTFREKRIPADVIYLDIHYMDGYRVFTWHPERFPDPVGLIKQLASLGFKVAVIIDPGVKVDANYRVAKEGLQNNHFVRYPDDEIYIGEVWPGPSYFPDFSREETRAWWGNLFGDLVNVGVKGFWNDMNEPAVWGKAFPEEVLFHDEGRVSSQKKMHNLYGFLMAKACYDGLTRLRPNERPLVITRAGFAGEQRFTSVWTGDNQATEEHLEMGIRMLQGLGISGVPFVGTDVGGFGGTPSPELFARWIESAVFAPFFRAHTHYDGSDQEPWSFGENVEEISKKFITRRYEGLPHLYSLFWEAHQTGAPILRPLFWHHQNDPHVYDGQWQEQFLVGENLLVAPVTRIGHNLKKVYLPPGQWLDLNTETVYDGGKAIIVDAPIDRLPMFLRSGGIIPSQEPMQYVGEKACTKLMLDIFAAGQSASYQFYEDDAESYDYASGKYRLTDLSVTKKGKELQISKTRSHDAYQPTERLLQLRVHAVAAPVAAIALGNTSLSEFKSSQNGTGYSYDAEKRILTIQFPDDAPKQSLTIKF
ncbi:MAG TPA: glycoside hydrolase family 31 protein [bacterium]